MNHKIELEEVLNHAKDVKFSRIGTGNPFTISCFIVSVFFAYQFLLKFTGDDYHLVNFSLLISALIFNGLGAAYALFLSNEGVVEYNQLYKAWEQRLLKPYISQLPMSQINTFEHLEHLPSYGTIEVGDVRKVVVKVTGEKVAGKTTYSFWTEIVCDESYTQPVMEYKEVKEAIPFTEGLYYFFAKNNPYFWATPNGYRKGIMEVRLFMNREKLEELGLAEIFD